MKRFSAYRCMCGYNAAVERAKAATDVAEAAKWEAVAKAWKSRWVAAL